VDYGCRSVCPFYVNWLRETLVPESSTLRPKALLQHGKRSRKKALEEHDNLVKPEVKLFPVLVPWFLSVAVFLPLIAVSYALGLGRYVYRDLSTKTKPTFTPVHSFLSTTMPWVTPSNCSSYPGTPLSALPAHEREDPP